MSSQHEQARGPAGVRSAMSRRAFFKGAGVSVFHGGCAERLPTLAIQGNAWRQL